MQKRHFDFVKDCRELASKGYTQPQIIDRLKEKYNFPTLSRSTIRRSIQEGLPASKGFTNNVSTLIKQSA